jgi:hypothetical protein
LAGQNKGEWVDASSQDDKGQPAIGNVAYLKL